MDTNRENIDRFCNQIRESKCSYDPNERADLESRSCERIGRTSKRSRKKHRSREEVIADIVEASQNSTTKTRIMRTCYLSYNLLQKYLPYTIENGLLHYSSSSNKYQVTRKGMQYIAYIEQCRDIEGELAHKKRLISEILTNNVECTMMASYAGRIE